jgi:hypothetical protein
MILKVERESPQLQTTSMDFKWTLGGDRNLVHQKYIGPGAHAEVHQVHF